jgi:hypothetical protein
MRPIFLVVIALAAASFADRAAFDSRYYRQIAAAAASAESNSITM